MKVCDNEFYGSSVKLSNPEVQTLRRALVIVDAIKEASIARLAGGVDDYHDYDDAVDHAEMGLYRLLNEDLQSGNTIVIPSDN